MHQLAFLLGFPKKLCAHCLNHISFSFSRLLWTCPLPISHFAFRALLPWPFQQEANVLGVANVTTALIGKAVAILVHGADFLPDLAAVATAAQSHDYRAVGFALKKVMDELYQWTQGHACTNNFCYVAIGVLEFMGNVQVRGTGSVAEASE
jgi:hypothetical protein